MKTKINSLMLLCMMFFGCAVNVMAQSDDEDRQPAIQAIVHNKFTGEKIDSITLTVMEMDSTIVQSFIPKSFYKWSVYDSVKRKGNFIFKFSKEGYFDAYVNAKLVAIPHRNLLNDLGYVYMRKKAKEIQLNEAVVTATKIKMVMKGDTIVYNADAFQMAQGSMLDKLITALPGVRLDPGGQISVNGKRVSSLLVNGEDFFKGDPRVALENLPAYMVDKIKVYERDDYGMMYNPNGVYYKRDDLPLVVDVNLKKQYSIGWIANAGVGYGTDNHWAARFFALRFTPNSRVALFGTSNDVMGTGYYNASNGNWNEPMGAVNIQSKTNQGGVDVLVKNHEETYKITGNAMATHTRSDNEGYSSSTTFLSPNNVYSRSRYDQTSKNLRVNSKWDIALKPNEDFSLRILPEGYFQHNENHYHSLKADFSAQLAEQYMGEALDSLFSSNRASMFRKNMISSLKYQNLSKGNNYGVSGESTLIQGFKTSFDHVAFKFGGKYDNQKSRSLYATADCNEVTGSSRFNTYNNNRYNVHGGAEYFFFVWGITKRDLNLSITPLYQIEKTHNSARAPYYLLENTDYEKWDVDRLASTKSELQQYIDGVNSYYSASDCLSQVGQVDFGLSNMKKHSHWELNMSLPVRFLHERLDYQRGALDTIANRNNTFFEPEMKFMIRQINFPAGKWRHKFELNYKYSFEAPSLLSMLNYRDDATPQVVRLGNSNLSNTQKHNVTWSVDRDDTYKLHTLSGTYTLWQNSVSQSLCYDKNTGVSTYQPVNISGNWLATVKYFFKCSLGKKRDFYFTMNTRGAYRNSADMLSTGSSVGSVRNSVRRWEMGQNVNLYFYKGGYQCIADADVTWVNAHGTYTSRLNAFDYTYGVRVSGPVHLWGIDFSTNMQMYSRRGYSDSNFNTDKFVWNASISKSVLHGNLNINLRAFDILNNMSSRSYSVNAQMQTESYNNVLRRYVMLQLTYKLNREPKKIQ